MHCPRCRTAVPRTARYCSQCGSVLTDATDRAASQNGHAQPSATCRDDPSVAQRVLDAAPLAIVALDLNGRIQHINRFLEELSGYRVDEVVGKDWFDTFLPERDRARIRGVFQLAITRTPTRGNRNPIVTRTGEERDLEWNAELQRDAQGQATGVVAIGQDITEQVRAERAAREAEERFRKLMEHSDKVVTLYDAETRIIYSSPSVREVLGFEPDELIGRQGFEFCHPDDLPEILARMPEVLDTPGAIGKLELRSRCKDGSYRWVEFIATNRLQDPTIRAVVGSYRDISAEKAIQETSRLHEQAIALSITPIAFADGEGRMSSVNAAFLRLWGYHSVAEVLGRRVDEFFTPPDQVQDALARLIAEGQWGGELVASRRDRTTFQAAVSAVAICDADGRLKTLMGSFIDVTEQRQTQLALQRSEERFRRLIENSADSIALYDANGKIIHKVPTTAEMLGYSPEELVGRESFELCHPDDLPGVKAALAEILLHPQNSVNLEMRCRHKDGSYRWVELVGTNQLDDPAVGAIVGNYRDITQRKEAEAREAARLAKLRRLSELSMRLAGDPSSVFEDVVRMVGELFGVRVVCLSEIVGDELLFKIVYVNGAVVADAGRCPLHVTPCATVVSARDLQVLDRVAERFPQAAFLREHAAWSYCGFPVLDADGNVAAILCLLDQQPREYSAEDQELLRLIGQRVAIELRRSSELAQQAETRAALQESETRLRLALSSANQGLWDLNVQTGEARVSPEYARMLGYDPETFVETNARWLERLHPDDADRVGAAFRRYIAGELDDYNVEFRQRTASGGWLWILSKGRVVARDDAGHPRRMVGTHTDISALKEAEQAVRESVERFRALFAAAPIPIVLNDVEGRYLAVNPAFEAATGYSANEVLGRTSREVSLIASDTSEVTAQLLTHGFVDGLEVLTSHKSGEPRNCLFSARIVTLGGEPQVLSLAVDITERKRAETALQASEERYRALVDALAEGVVMQDAQGRIIACNRRAEDILGLTRSQIEGRTSLDSVWRTVRADGTPFPGAEHPAMLTLRTGEPVSNTVMGIDRPDGSRVWISINSEPVRRGSDGSISAVVTSFHNVTEVRELLEQVRSSEARLRTILDSSPLCVKVVDAECRILEMNRAGLQLIQADDADFTPGVDAFLRLPPEHHATFRQTVIDAFEGRSSRVEYEVIGMRGMRRSIEQHAVPLRDPSRPEVIVGMLAVSHDVTERRRAEAALRESEERFRVFFEAAPFAVTLNAMDGPFTAVNPAFEQFSGYTADEVLGRVPADLGMGSRQPGPEPTLSQLKRIGRLDNVEAVSRRKDGLVRDCLFSSRVITVGGERQILSASIDITERKRAEESLKTSEQRLAEAQRIAHIGNWHWDSATDVITWSDEVYRIFGYAAKSISPRYEIEFLQAVHPDDRLTLKAAVQSSLETGSPFSIEHRVCRPDGSERVVREKGEVVYDESCRPVGMVGTVQDITERTEAEAQMKLLRDELAHVARLGTLGELAAGIAHELNQPLAAIANYAFTLESVFAREGADAPTDPVENGLPLIRRIADQATRGGEIIRRLQALIRNKASQRSAVHLARLAQEVLALLAGDLRLMQVELEVDISEDLPPVLVDPVQIQQVLFNLIRNSMESLLHQPDNRRLSIVVGIERDGLLTIRVRDSGAGVPAEMQSRLFTPFATSKPQGLGLGLPISKRIIESHGGEIQWNSAVESGFEVCFTLPVAD